MSQKIYATGLTADEADTLNALIAHLEAKGPRNLLRASYYDGKRAILRALEAVLGVRLAEPDPQHRYEITRGQCNGTCDNAPQVWVNGKVVGDLTVAKAIELARGLKGAE